MGSILQKYQVKHGDRIQEVAARVLGDTKRWIDIVALNSLRRPYISDDLIDQFGPMLGILPLQFDLVLGDTSIHNWDSTVSSISNNRSYNSSSILVPGAILVFTYMNYLGDRIYDAVQLTNVTQGMLYSNGHISLDMDFVGVKSYRSLTRRLVLRGNDPSNNENPGLLHDYPAGTLFQVFGSPLQLTTGVARTGDSLNLPVVQSFSDYNITSIKDIIDSLGVDVLLDPQTGQKKAGPNGDLAMVQGMDNVKQAIRIRCSTEPGELLLHPEYGDNLKFYIGYNQESGWPNLATTLLYECIMQDPRVKEVKNMLFRQVGDASFIDVTIVINQTGQIFTTTVRVV